MAAEGKNDYQALLDGGFTAEEAYAWKEQQKQMLLDGGFSEKEVREYFGEPDPNDDGGIGTEVQSNKIEFYDSTGKKTTPTVAKADSFMENMAAGWDTSATVLPFGAPESLPSKNPTYMGALGMAVGRLAGDLIPGVAGAIGGGIAGAAAGGASGAPSGPGALVTAAGGMIIGAGAGGAAAPEAIRQAYMTYYQTRPDATVADVIDRSLAAAGTVAKTAAVGALAAPIGGLAARPVLNATGSVATAAVANNLANAGAGTVLGAAAEGRLPNGQDAAVAATLVLGLDAAGTLVGATRRLVPSPQHKIVTGNIEEVHIKTGLPPWTQAEMSKENKAFYQEINSIMPDGSPYVGPVAREAALDEPAPNKPRPDLSQTDPDLEQEQAAIKAKGEEPAPPRKLTQADWDAEQDAKYESFIERYVEPKTGRTVNAEEITNMARFLERSDAAARRAGISPHQVVSPAGAIGMYQIMPNTAKAFGVSREQLFNPEINKRVAVQLAKELLGRPKYKLPDGSPDIEAILADYNGGPSKALKFLRNRDLNDLPAETRGYIQRARDAGFVTGNWVRGKDGVVEKVTIDGIKPFKPDFSAYLNARDITSKVGRDKIITPAPGVVASYMESFGREAGFKFVVGPEQVKRGGADGPMFVNVETVKEGRKKSGAYVYIPDTPEETFRRWYGLGRSEILFHEAGHAVHRNVLKDAKLTAAIRAEAEAVSRQFRPKLWSENPKYNSTQSELMADAIAVWLSRPDLRKEMPEFGKAFAKALDPYVFFAERNLPVKDAQKGGGGDGGRGDGGDGKGGGGEPPGADGAGGASGGGKPPAPPGGGDVGPAGKPPKKEPEFELTREMLNAKIGDAIASPKQQGLIAGAKDVFESQVIGIFSELEPFRRADNRMKREGRIDENFFGLEDSFRLTYSSTDRASAFLTDGVVRYSGDRFKLVNKASVEGAFKQAKKAGGTQEEFINYMIARRVVEKAAQGKKNLTNKFTVEEAQAFIKKTSKEYEGAAKTLRTVFHGLLDYQVDAGLLSAKAAQKVKDTNQYYIPFRRHIEDGVTVNVPGKGFTARKTVKEMSGSERELVEPTLAMYEHIFASVAMADRNMAIRSLTDSKDYRKVFYAQISDSRPVTEVEMPDGTKIKIDGNEPIPPDALTALGLEQGRRMAGKNEFIVYKNGVGTIWTVKDKDLAEVIRGAGKDEANWILLTMRFPAMMQRRGITDTVDFTIRSILRESIGASVLFKDAGFPMQNVIEGTWGFFADAPGFKEFAINGGLSAAISEMDANIMQKKLDQVFKDTGVTGRLLNSAATPIEALHTFASWTDGMGRFGYTKKLEREGMPYLKAVMKGRTSRLDFKEKGTNATLQTWASMTPFLRSRLSGMRQLAQQVGSDPAGVALRAGMYITLPTVLLFALNQLADLDKDENDPTRWTNVDRWVKDTNWLVPLPNGGHLKIPKPFELGFVFGTSVERFLDYSYHNDPTAFDKWSAGLFAQLYVDLMPTAPKAIIEGAANYSFFRGQPLVPASVEQASGYMQWTPSTTETAKALAAIVGEPGLGVADISPIVLENYVRGYTGALGMQMLQALDMTGELAGLTPERARNWGDMPFYASFFTRYGMNAAPISDFYELYGEFQRVQKDISLAKRREDFSALERLADDPEATVKLQNVAQALSMTRLVIDGIQRDETMTPEEKRQFIDDQIMLAIGTARDANDLMRGVQEEAE